MSSASEGDGIPRPNGVFSTLPESQTDVWRAFTLEERRAALLIAVADRAGDVREWAEEQVVRRHNFRRKFVRGMLPKALVKWSSGLTPEDPDILDELIRGFYLAERVDLLSAYLDFLGLTHERGNLTDEEGAEDLSPEHAEQSALGLLESFPPRDVVLYIAALRAVSPVLVPGVETWGDRFLRHVRPLLPRTDVESQGERSDPEQLPTDPAEFIKAGSEYGPTGSEGSESDEEHFTTLDEVLIRTIVNSAQGVTGALDSDKAGDLVEEVLALNGTRHRSYFHLGFYDALVSGDLSRTLPAENRSRASWYWAGVVTGMARSSRHAAIADLFDHTPQIRALSGETGAQARLAGRLVLDAMIEVGRAPEVAEQMTARSIAAIPGAPDALLAEARRLLSRERATEAKGVLDKLGLFVEHVLADGAPPADRFLLEIQRRRAHGFRQLGQTAEAETLLRAILELEEDRDITAMIHADLGLLEGGFRSLASVALPDDRDAAHQVRRSLEAGEESFHRSVEVDGRFSAHGHFCLGTLEILRESWDLATKHLERALAVFDSEPERYAYGDPLFELGGRRRSLGQRTRLYLGLATVHSLDHVRAPQAADRVIRAVDDTERVPGFLLDGLIHGLSLLSQEDAKAVTEALVEADPDLLERLPEPDVLRESQVLRGLLLARASDRRRPHSSRAHDYRLVLPYLLSAGDRDKGEDVLDALETLAVDRVGVEEFLELLEHPDSFEPAWSREDAAWTRVRLLLMSNRQDETATLLRAEFFQALRSGRYGSREMAQSIVEALQVCGANDASLSDLRAALDASQEEAIELEGVRERPKHQPIRILFCGGDERQQPAARKLEEELSQTRPDLRVEFELVGWSSNWHESLDRIQGRLHRYDAVVMMRFMRTMFGRRLRASLEVPWVPCVNAGYSTMRRSILTAAAWAADAS
ncbi:hypothetical protein WI372_17240 [Gemmatimonadota bacterium DH-20]|uniref:Tetratricopeptide repeat protein n=1 Tax=Gaopeijia maritima TaxID=3119007 RepID=A0ABU9EF05_9BACT